MEQFDILTYETVNRFHNTLRMTVIYCKPIKCRRVICVVFVVKSRVGPSSCWDFPRSHKHKIQTSLSDFNVGQNDLWKFHFQGCFFTSCPQEQNELRNYTDQTDWKKLNNFHCLRATKITYACVKLKWSINKTLMFFRRLEQILLIIVFYFMKGILFETITLPKQ